jgi:hypothetical protein
MQRFSDRIGVTKPPAAMQLTDMSEPLKNSLWNLVLLCFDKSVPITPRGQVTFWEPITRALAVEFFKEPVDSVPLAAANYAKTWLRERFSELPWYDVYNLVEFLVQRVRQLTRGHLSDEALCRMANEILERELSGYRFIEGRLVPITNEAEVRAIAEATEMAATQGLEGVRTHIRTALGLLAKKPDPDYRNSIKESISAVESAARQIAGEGGALKDALAALEKKGVTLHGALKAGVLNLYGYTSDEDGIRHAILDEPRVGFDEAKFMLVACSAFATFLMSKAAASSQS